MLNKLHIFIDHNFLVTLYMYIIYGGIYSDKHKGGSEGE